MEEEKVLWEIKDGEVEEEIADLRELFTLPLNKCLTYIAFIRDKGLFKEFDEWRKKKLLEVG
jgi:hypothetical protein